MEYVLRHVPPSDRQSAPITLTGYGVSLDLKKTDYLAVDDRLAAKSKNPAVSLRDEEQEAVAVDPVTKLIEEFPENNTTPDSKSLTSEEFAALGPQVVQLIANSEEPLDTLIAISQNFPRYVKTIPRRVIANASITEELEYNAKKAQPGVNMLWINGGTVETTNVEPLGLLRQLKKERELMISLTSAGLSRSQALEVLTHSNITAAQRNDGGVADGLFDASDRPEGGDLIVYWNDILKDHRYSQFSRSLYAVSSWPTRLLAALCSRLYLSYFDQCILVSSPVSGPTCLMSFSPWISPKLAVCTS